ncbi:cAMP receptor protein [Candidatus Izimaplasma bacterium HR1]|nr:cAMP receptor protein [Candidatus Izimaplasma bacterium HR1]
MLYSFMIVEGLVKISKITINGEEKIFDIFGPDDFIALVSMLKEDDKYIATATCLTEVKLNLLRKDDVIQAYRSNNKFKDICMSCAMTRTNLFQSQLFNSTNSDIEERILQVLKYLSTKFGKSTGDLLTLKLPFSKTTLASIVGIRRETLSRRLTSMQKDNLIEINKNIYKFNRM